MSAENPPDTGGDIPYVPTEPLGPQEPIESQLARQLHTLVQTPEMNLPAMVRNDERLQMAQDAPGGGKQHKPPKNIDQYNFVPIIRVRGCTEHQLSGDDYALPANVQTHYENGPGRKPVLDAPIGIGITITRDDGVHLCAVSTAEANSDTGVIDVVQLQGAITQEGVKPELGGFNWAGTLVEAWERVAGHVGATAITIQSAELLTGTHDTTEANNPRTRIKLQRYNTRYNQTADRMGYTRPDPSSPYHKPVVSGSRLTMPPAETGPGPVNECRRIIQGVIYQLTNPQGSILGNVLASQYQVHWAGEELRFADLVDTVEYTSGASFPNEVHDNYTAIWETYVQIAGLYETDIVSKLVRAAELLANYVSKL